MNFLSKASSSALFLCGISCFGVAYAATGSVSTGAVVTTPTDPVVTTGTTTPIDPVVTTGTTAPAKTRTNPIIVLKKKNTTISIGSSLDLRSLVTARDKEDGDLTSKLTISNDGGFDSNKEGKYIIVYLVSDSDGDAASAKAYVTVGSGVDSIKNSKDPGSADTGIKDEVNVVGSEENDDIDADVDANTGVDASDDKHVKSDTKKEVSDTIININLSYMLRFFGAFLLVVAVMSWRSVHKKSTK